MFLRRVPLESMAWLVNVVVVVAAAVDSAGQ